MDRFQYNLALTKIALSDKEAGAYALSFLCHAVELEELQACLTAVREFIATPSNPKPDERLLTLVRERFPHPPG